jgi:hypothetical protein
MGAAPITLFLDLPRLGCSSTVGTIRISGVVSMCSEVSAEVVVFVGVFAVSSAPNADCTVGSEPEEAR